jgi:N-acetylmuramoyl-L-alanine amidase
MALAHAFAVSLALVLAALAGAAADPQTVPPGGQNYVEASSLAARLGARLEHTQDRIYLRTPGHVVALTRGWARVEVNGKAVVLAAPVRVDGDRWLVPDAFMRQVMPMLEAPAARAAAPAAPPTRVIEAPRPATAKASEPTGAAAPPPPVRVIEAPKAPAGSPPAEAPKPAVAELRVIEAPRSPVGSPPAEAPNPAVAEPRVIEAPRPAMVPLPAEAVKPPAAEPKVVEAPRPSVAQIKLVDAPRVGGPEVKVIEAPRSPAGGMTIVEAPKASPQSVARAVESSRAAPAPKVAVPGAALEDLRVRSYPTFTRVVVETSAAVRHRIEVVTPREVRVRLSALEASRRAETLRDGLIDEVQLDPADGDAVLRVTFPAASQEPRTSVLSDPPRLIFDFVRPAEPTPRAPGAPSSALRTLVLDAGHGGHDSGAVGPAGLMEKDLVLDVTRRVATLVEANLPGIRVLLSRKGDYFVPLRERTSFANRERAELFVSIHANAHREVASEGVETYFLSSEATDNAARQVAAAENSVVRLERPTARGSRGDVVKAILWDLAQSEFQQES